MIKSPRQVHSLPVIFANQYYFWSSLQAENFHSGSWLILTLGEDVSGVRTVSAITIRDHKKTEHGKLNASPKPCFPPRVWDVSRRAERCKILIFLLNARLLTYSYMLLLIECEDSHHCITLQSLFITQVISIRSRTFCRILLDSSKGWNYD